MARAHWFTFSRLKRLLAGNGFKAVDAYSDPSEETFDENEHADMWFVTSTR